MSKEAKWSVSDNKLDYSQASTIQILLRSTSLLKQAPIYS